MKKFLSFLPFILSAQTIPTLPPVNTITAAGVTCTFSVIDPQTSVASQCLLADGTILSQSVNSPNTKGSLLGTGPILCLLWSEDTSVRLQCSIDDDITLPKLVLDGKLTPVNKKRQWWFFWR